MLYLIPPFTDTKPQVMNLISRAGVTYVDASELYDLWPYVRSAAITIASVPPGLMAVLNMHMGTLLPEVPAAVTGVPGAFYSAEWNMLAAHLPQETWGMMEGKLAKSGLLAHDAQQGEERGARVLSTPALAGAAQPASEDEDDTLTL
nr:MAG: hypothetical protein 1 [Jiangsu sediment cysto-like virus 2]